MDRNISNQNTIFLPEKHVYVWHEHFSQMFLLFSRWRAIFTWWHKHFFPSQRNFHSSDSGSLVIDCLARWAPFTKSKCWIYLPILLYSKCRACKLVLVIRNGNLNLRRYFLILFYNQLLPPDKALLLQQWSSRPSTTAEATLGSHRRYIEFPRKYLHLSYLFSDSSSLARPHSNSTACGWGKSCSWSSPGFFRDNDLW